MPGICGVVRYGPTVPDSDDIASMTRRLCRFPWHRVSRLDLPGVSLGAASVDPPGETAASPVAADSSLAIAFDGELYRPALTGSDRSRSVSRIEKIAVFAPIPRARDRIATADTTGVAFKARNPSRRSPISSLQDITFDAVDPQLVGRACLMRSSEIRIAARPPK